MSSFSSYEKDKERFDGWRRYLLKEETDLDTAAANVSSGKYSKEDLNIVLSLFKKLEGSDQKPTVGGFKALIRIIAIDMQTGGGFMKKLAEIGASEAAGAAVGSWFGPVLALGKIGAGVAKKSKLKKLDLETVLSKLIMMPDEAETPAMMQVLDLSDGFSDNLNQEALNYFLNDLHDAIEGFPDETVIPAGYSDQEMAKSLEKRKLIVKKVG